MPLVKLPTSKLFWVRVATLLFTCIAFSTAARLDHLIFLIAGPLINGFICCWAVSFTCTLLILLVELSGLQIRAPVIWSNFTVTVALYAAALPPVCSSLAYAVETRMSKAKPNEEKGYMCTNPGELKVCQTFIACLIFIILSFVPYDYFPELRWCMAVYCICFIVSVAVVVLCVCERTGSLPVPFPKFLFVYDLLAVIMYLSAIIIWGLHFGGLIDVYFGTVFLIIMSVFTSCNFLFYLADLVYCAKLLFLSDQN